MDTKENKITPDDFEAAALSDHSPTTVVDWNGLTVEVRRNITLLEMLSFVENVVKCCFVEPDGVYAPELKDFAIRTAIVELYTNISTPEDMHQKYDVLYATDICKTVLENIDKTQFNSIVSAIDDRINALVSSNVHMINKQVNEFYQSLDNMQKQFSSMFDGIDSNDIKNLVGAVVNGGISEEKLVKAYLENKDK